MGVLGVSLFKNMKDHLVCTDLFFWVIAWPMKTMRTILRMLMIQKQKMPKLCIGLMVCQRGFDGMICPHRISCVKMKMKSNRVARARHTIILVET